MPVMKLDARDITSLRKLGADYVRDEGPPSLDMAVRLANARIHSSVKDSVTGEPLNVIVAEYIYKGMLAANKKR